MRRRPANAAEQSYLRYRKQFSRMTVAEHAQRIGQLANQFGTFDQLPSVDLRGEDPSAFTVITAIRCVIDQGMHQDAAKSLLEDTLGKPWEKCLDEALEYEAIQFYLTRASCVFTLFRVLMFEDALTEQTGPGGVLRIVLQMTIIRSLREQARMPTYEELIEKRDSLSSKTKTPWREPPLVNAQRYEELMQLREG